jgi:hypothetical protein
MTRTQLTNAETESSIRRGTSTATESSGCRAVFDSHRELLKRMNRLPAATSSTSASSANNGGTRPLPETRCTSSLPPCAILDLYRLLPCRRLERIQAQERESVHQVVSPPMQNVLSLDGCANLWRRDVDDTLLNQSPSAG